MAAGGCSPGGHFGRVYVDGLGATVPGLYATAEGPEAATPNDRIDYTIRYANGGNTTAAGAAFRMQTPPMTAFLATDGTSCITPAIGQAGSIVCSLGSVAPGTVGSLSISVQADANATGTLVNGNYGVGTTDGAFLLGMPATTALLPVGSTLTDVEVAHAPPEAAAVLPGSTVQLAFSIHNAGPADLGAGMLTVSDTLPAGLTPLAWRCAADAGGDNRAQCGRSSGSGSIIARPTVPAGASLTYVMTALVAADLPPSRLVHAPSATVLGGVTDVVKGNNVATAVLDVGPAVQLHLNKVGAANLGSVQVMPYGTACGRTCGAQTVTVAQNANLQLVAQPAPGNVFVGWSGACGGTHTSCALSLEANRTVSAAFAVAPTPSSPVTTVAFAGSNQSAPLGRAFALPLSAWVGDANGQGVPGIEVKFSAPATGASSTPTAQTATTDGTGVATVSVLANGTAGKYAVAATLPAYSTSPTTFALSNAGVPSTLRYVSGGDSSNVQAAAVGATFASRLVAQVLDSRGVPVPGAQVTFSAPTSGASASCTPATATADAMGLVNTRATANGTTGAFTVGASAAGLSSKLNFALTNNSASVRAVAVVSGAGQRAASGSAFARPLAVVVTNSTGDGLPGVVVTFTSPSTGPSTAQTKATATTDARGVAQVNVAANATPGAYVVQATAVGVLTGAPFALTNGGTQYIDAADGGGQVGVIGQPLPAPLVALVTDATGAPVAGVPVAFAVAPGSAALQLAPARAVTDSQGLAQASVTAGASAGTTTVTASCAAAAMPALFAISQGAGAPASMQLISGASQSTPVRQNFPVPIKARIFDSAGNPVPGVTVQFSSEAADGPSPSSTATSTDAAGVASITAAAGGQAGTFTITVTGPKPILPQQAALVQQPGAVAQLVLQSGAGGAAQVGTALPAPVVLLAQDAQGNPVPDAQVQLLFPSSGPSGSTPTGIARTDSGGLARFSITAGSMAGSYKAQAKLPDANDAGPTQSIALFNLNGPADGLTVVSGDGQAQQGNELFAAPIVLLVADALGNPVPGAGVVLQAPTSGPSATVEAAHSFSDSSGRVAFVARANAWAGTFTFLAQLDGVQVSRAVQARNLPGKAAQLTLVSGDNQQSTAGDLLAAPWVVRVTDDVGNAVQGANVTIAATSTGPSVTAVAGPRTSDANGTVGLEVRAGTAAGHGVATVHLQYSGDDAPEAASQEAPGVPFHVDVLPSQAARISRVSDANIALTVQAALEAPLTVRALDAYGNFVPSATIAFAVPAAGPRLLLDANQATTDSAGLAQLGGSAGSEAGTSAVVASLLGVDEQVTFRVQLLPGAAARLSVVGGADQSTPVTTAMAQQLQVLASDAAGNAVPGARVAFRAPSDGPSATLSQALGTTDGQGMAQVVGQTNQQAGMWRALATLLDDNDGPQDHVTLLQYNVAGSPTLAVVAGGDGQSTAVATDFAAPFVVRISDAFNNPIAGVPVVFSAPPTGASAALSAVPVVSNSSGLAARRGRANTIAGAYGVTAGIVDSTTSVTFAAVNVSGSASSLLATGGDGQSVQVLEPYNRPLCAQVADADGNPVQRAALAFSLAADSVAASISAKTVYTDGAGGACVYVQAGSQAGVLKLQAALTQDVWVQWALEVLPGPVAVLASDSSAQAMGAQVGTAFARALSVCAKDAYGNSVPHAALTVAVPQTGATAIAEKLQLVTDGNGIAAAAVAANALTGAYAVIIAADDRPALQATFTLRNLAGPAHTLTLVAGTGAAATVQTPFAEPLQLRLADALGNPVPGATVVLNAAASGPSAALGERLLITDAGGYATTTATANTMAGTHAVHATFGGSARAETFVLTNLAGAAVALEADPVSAPQQATVRTTFAQALRVRAVDALGNGVAGQHVTWRVAPTGATLSALSASTDADGWAQVTATAGATPGLCAVHAAADGVGQQVEFILLNSLDGPAHLSSPTGTVQAATVGAAFANPLVLQVQDELGSPLPDVQVQFSVPASGASALVAPTAITDDSGTVEVFAQAGTMAGNYNVVAQYAGAAAPLLFRLTNLEAAPAQLDAEPESSPQAARVAEPFALPLTVVVRDTLGNPTPGVQVTFDITAGDAGVVLSATRVQTDASGRAETTGIAGAPGSATTVTASLPSLGRMLKFELKSLPEAPPLLSVTGGSAQSAEAGQPFGEPLRFALRAADGSVLPNTTITLEAPQDTIDLVEDAPQTDRNGYFTARASAGLVPGVYVVRATAADAAAPAMARLTVTAVATETRLSLPSAPYLAGVPLAFVGHVSAQTDVPQGEAQLWSDGALLCTARIDSHGDAHLNAALSSGNHALRLMYVGENPFGGSVSATELVTVNGTAHLRGGGCQQAPNAPLTQLPWWAVPVGWVLRRQRQRRSHGTAHGAHRCG